MTEGTSEQGRGIGGISIRAAAWLAWSLATLSLIMFVANVALYIIIPHPHSLRSPGAPVA